MCLCFVPSRELIIYVINASIREVLKISQDFDKLQYSVIVHLDLIKLNLLIH